jgi:hypothetical protein
MSLDLNKLENKLDEALSNETSQTLTKFLNDKRMENNKQQTAVDFVPYELALELKQLGFDEPCFAFYDESLYFPNNENQYGTFCNQKLDASSCSAPTYSQAFRWFRDKHNLRCQINYIGGLINETTWWDISVIGHYNTNPKEWEMKYQPYEEAELACLKKLIEIVKTYGGGEQ